MFLPPTLQGILVEHYNTEQSKVIIIDNNFYNNKAYIGGAISAALDDFISRNKFMSHSPCTSRAKSSMSNKVCVYTDNKFQNNTAINSGGAVYTINSSIESSDIFYTVTP